MSDKVQQLIDQANRENDANKAKEIAQEAVKTADNEHVDSNLYAKARIALGDALLKNKDTNGAIEEYKKAVKLDEEDGKVDSPELKDKLNKLVDQVSSKLQKSVDENPNADSNEKGISSMSIRWFGFHFG
ncbi:unnamed protein product [Ambrosiozyma monospora]|uniref:Unnamed protein product n=1 Tax=Ambrosiozyma monospora TaxID=43982 RepID=A0ACB5U7T7_AMBMO|nr:unnamed protein product [Ambrosiozyma monospora]